MTNLEMGLILLMIIFGLSGLGASWCVGHLRQPAVTGRQRGFWETPRNIVFLMISLAGPVGVLAYSVGGQIAQNSQRPMVIVIRQLPGP
jgi:hypothetical protein